jgi:hypothetical protein
MRTGWLHYLLTPCISANAPRNPSTSSSLPALEQRLSGNGTQWLHERDASVLIWSGGVSFVHIAVFGGQADIRAVILILGKANLAMVPPQLDNSGYQEQSLIGRERYLQFTQRFSEMNLIWSFRPLRTMAPCP